MESKEEGVEWKKERGLVCVWWYVFGAVLSATCAGFIFDLKMWTSLGWYHF